MAETSANLIKGDPPPQPPQICLTPLALEAILFPECEDAHPDCFIEFFHGDDGKQIRKSVFSSSFFRTVGLGGSGKSSSMRGRSATAGGTPTATPMDGNDIAEMFGFIEAPTTPASSSSSLSSSSALSSSSSSSSSSHSNVKLPLPPQEDMIARALGAASGYGEDLLLRQQENFAKKVQNRSRSLAQNDFGNSWTRRIPVYPQAHPQTKQLPKQGAREHQRPMSVPHPSNKKSIQQESSSLKNTEGGKLKERTAVEESVSSLEVDVSIDAKEDNGEDGSPTRNLPSNHSLSTMQERTRSPTAPPDMEKPTTDALRASSASFSTPSSSSSSSSSMANSNAEIVVHNLAPEAFRAVRKVFGFSFKRFARSLGAAPLLPKGNGGGRSGARFFLSHDQRYVVKSIILEEVNVLLGLLPDYLEHVISNATHTLLPRFLGLFRVELPGVKSSIDLIVMPNLFRLRVGCEIKLKNCYDLKGCFYKGRYEKPDEKESLKVLKDRNFCPHHVRKKDPFRFSNSTHGISSSSLSSLTSASSSSSSSSNVCSERRHALVDKSNGTSSPPPSGLSSASGSANETELEDNLESNTVGIDGVGPSASVVDLCEYDDDDDSGAVCEKLRLGYDRKAVFISNLRNDTHWLQEHGLMDYSILLAVGTCRVKKVMSEKKARKQKNDRASELFNQGSTSQRTTLEASFRYGTPSAEQQTEEELKYLLSSRKPLDGREIERVQELIRATKDVDVEKEKDEILEDSHDEDEQDDGEKEDIKKTTQVKSNDSALTQTNEPKKKDKLDRKILQNKRREEGDARKGLDLGSFRSPVSLQAVMGDDDDMSSDEEGGTKRPKRIVSYWESELGGVSAAERNTGIRITMSQNADNFDLSFNHSKKKNGSKETRTARSLTCEELEKAPGFDQADNEDEDEDEFEDEDDEREWYRFGLIDILQTWNMRKRAENIAKVTMMGVDPNAVSSINPKKYADRMTTFFEKHTS